MSHLLYPLNLAEIEHEEYDTGWVANSTWQGADLIVTHNLNATPQELEVEFLLSPTASLPTTYEGYIPINVTSTTGTTGHTIIFTGANTLKIQTGNNGVTWINNAGSISTLTTQAWYYMVRVKKAQPSQTILAPGTGFPLDAWEAVPAGSVDEVSELTLKSPWQLGHDIAPAHETTTYTESDTPIVATPRDLTRVIMINMSGATAEFDYTLPLASEIPEGTIVTILRGGGIVPQYPVNIKFPGSDGIYLADNIFYQGDFQFLYFSDRITLAKFGPTAWLRLDTPYWHKIRNPDTGTHASKSSGWVADTWATMQTFSSAGVPLGSLAVRVAYTVDPGQANQFMFYRKAGDGNISSTPFASQEWSHSQALLTADAINRAVATWWIDVTTREVDIAMRYATAQPNLNIRHPIEYLQ